MKKDQVLDFMGSLEREDESFLQATAENGGSCRWRFVCDTDEKYDRPGPI